MKIFLLILTVFLLFQSVVFSFDNAYTTENMTVYSSKNLYGLKDKSDNIIVEARYKKIIRLGKSAWIVQKKNNKFGLIDCSGNYLVKAKYSHVERLFDKWVKLGNEKDYGLYDETGKVIIPPEFTSIEPLFGMKFLTCKKYKYGVYNSQGKMLLDNEYDFIYNPTPKILRIKYNGNWYDIEKITEEEAINLPEGAVKVRFDDNDFKITQIFINTGIGTGYSVVTAADYMLKVLSTISTAYESTIDELMLSQGAETVSIFMKLSWIPKFPFVYAKKYYNNLITPNSGPLSDIREDIKNKFK